MSDLSRPDERTSAPGRLRANTQDPGSSRSYGWLLALTSLFCFSLATPIARGLLLTGAVPTALVLVRLALATSLHGTTLALTSPGLLRPRPRGLAIALGSGGINGVGMLLYFYALTRLDASITAMLLATSPLVVLSLLTLRGERLTYRHGVRVGLALLGVYLLIGPGGQVDFLGVGLVLLAVLAFSTQLVVAQWYLKPFDARTITFYTNLGMLLMVGVAWLGQGMPWQELSPGGWLAVGVLAVVSTFLARWAMYSALAHIGSGQMALLNPLEILLAVLWSVLFLHEQLAPLHWLGGGVILVSALLASQRIGMAKQRPRWRIWIRQ